ncbi:helix-turn-helix transcriptional regulator [uncultured Faecalicoccus sp.]|uniref:helix-turn-helix domain-containing protein n=1 Tax=uncultured Faecalicoccus sp. TaxID=1971760 RepID=UPI002636175B|nr:helix-turn-helix transcriptional regulator [uncultured Faecalicoccus sp.]
MKNQSFGQMISSLRKEKGMTQLELAEKMGVTDKAVSKWERDLSFPDVNSIPKIAEIFEISIDELMQTKNSTDKKTDNTEISEILDIALKGIALAMGIAVVVLSFLNQIEIKNAMSLLGIGLVCLALSQFSNKNKDQG